MDATLPNCLLGQASATANSGPLYSLVETPSLGLFANFAFTSFNLPPMTEGQTCDRPNMVIKAYSAMLGEVCRLIWIPLIAGAVVGVGGFQPIWRC